MDVFEVSIVSLVVFLIPFLLIGIHFRKYGYIQGFISLITVPVVAYGIGELSMLIFKNNSEVFEILTQAFAGLRQIVEVYRRLMTFTEVKWLYETNWFYLPFAALLFLSWTFSMTLRHKKLKQKVKA